MIRKIEPPCWWIGMNTPLEIMIYGENLRGYDIKSSDKNIRIKELHLVENPNYLFVEIEISPKAQPGTYMFELAKDEQVITFEYDFLARREGSACRKSYSSADMIYLVMPDRFAKGEIEIEWEGIKEKINRKDPLGRHGGNLQGIIDHLDYFSDLGVTTLWITPPQLDNEEKQSYHGYACADYYNIDPRFGTNELYKELVQKAHEKDLKVIMDAVPNHCGLAHWWMNDLPAEDWVHYPKTFIPSNYRLASIMDPNGSCSVREQTVNGWFDNSMPDLCMENPHLANYLLQLYIWWIEWADLDGLRVDTYPYNHKGAISVWTKKILEEYPKLNIVAECWHSSPAIVAYWQRNKNNGDGYNSHLPAVMDFPLQEAITRALEEDSSDWESGMNNLYEALALDFLYPDRNNLMIFLDNHDTDRFSDSMKGNSSIIKIGITLLATLRGIPQLYYGTEYGCRSTNLSEGHGSARSDFPGGWKGDRKDIFNRVNINKKEQEIFEFTSFLFNWRKKSTPIHTGKTMHFLPYNNTYGYFRYTENESVFVFLNPSGKTVDIHWDRFSECLTDYNKGRNIFTDEEVIIGNSYKVGPESQVILELYR